MTQVSDYQRVGDSSNSVTYVKNQAQLSEPPRRVILTVPLLQIKVKSRKNKDKMVTRGFYVNIPKSTVESMDLKERDQIEITLRKAK